MALHKFLKKNLDTDPSHHLKVSLHQLQYQVSRRKEGLMLVKLKLKILQKKVIRTNKESKE